MSSHPRPLLREDNLVLTAICSEQTGFQRRERRRIGCLELDWFQLNFTFVPTLSPSVNHQKIKSFTASTGGKKEMANFI